MQKRVPLKKLWVAALLLLPLTGCTVHITQGVTKRLKVSEMNRSFGVNPVDLGARSKCEENASVRIVNLESRSEDFFALHNPPYRGVINPQELMDAVTSYLEDSYRLSQIRVMPESSKVLQLKMVDLMARPGGWTFGSSFKTELTIPEIGFQKIYEGTDNAANGHTAAADAIAMAARNILDDPEIQDYLLCSNAAPALVAQPVSGEAQPVSGEAQPVSGEPPSDSGEPVSVSNDPVSVTQELGEVQEQGEELGAAQEQGQITQEEYRLEREEPLKEN